MSKFFWGWGSCLIMYSVLELAGILNQKISQMGGMSFLYIALCIAWYFSMKALADWIHRKDGSNDS